MPGITARLRDADGLVCWLTAVEDALAVLKGRRPAHPVNPEV